MIGKIEGNFKEFQFTLLTSVKPMFDEIQSKGKVKTYQEAFANTLFGRDGPRGIDTPLTQKEMFIGKIFYGFLEIYNSFEALNDIPLYMKRFPAKSLQISKPQYLHYHITNYLNEAYILKERLQASVDHGFGGREE